MDDRVRFGPFEFDARAGELRKRGVTLKIVGQPLEVLRMLLERPGEVVTREELRRRLWDADTFVDFDHGLNAAVNKLRIALGDSAEHPRYVRTVPRRGYAFEGPIEVVRPATDPLVAPVAPRLPAAGSRSTAWRRVSAALLLTAGVLGVGVWRTGTQSAVEEAPQRVTLVILPFENLSSDREQDYFADGLTDEMITILGQLDPERLGVIARTSASSFQGEPRRVRQIAAELGVQYVVDGSVRREGDRVRVNARLVRAADEAHLWARSYDRDVRELLAVQEDLARAIADGIELTLAPSGGRSAGGREPEPAVYEAYLRGRYFLGRRTAEAVTKGHEYLETAVGRDPEFALGHAGLAQAFVLLASYRAVSPAEAVPRALQAGRRSLELDPGLAEGHAVLAVIHCNYGWNWTEAVREFRRALQISPNSVDTRLKYAECLSYLGHLDEAVHEAAEALRLDPISLVANAHAAIILYRARRYDEALDRLQTMLELDSSYAVAYLNLGLVYAAQGRYEEAVTALEKGRSLDGASLDLSGLLAGALARAGRTAEAAALLQELRRRRAGDEFVQPYTLALVHLALGDTEAAVEWLERGAEERSWLTALIKVAPELDALRGHPRFEALVRRLSFPE